MQHPLCESSGALQHGDAITDISGTASGEAQLEFSLAAVQKAWSKMEFNVNEFRETKNLYILGSLEEILTLLEDNQVTLQTMLGSRYIRTIQEVGSGESCMRCCFVLWL